jgi:hypothetical protein
MHLRCVVRVESIGQDSTTSLWGKSCRRGATWASLKRGTCGGCMCEQTGCWLSPVVVPSRHGVLVIPLRRYPVRSPQGLVCLENRNHGTLRAHHTLLMGGR